METAGPDLETAITRLGTSLLHPEAAKAAFASQQWPGWYSDTQIASEYAQRLARGLPAAVNASLIAQGWLAHKGLVPRHRRGVPPRRRKKRRRSSGGASAPPQRRTQPQHGQQAAQRPVTRRPAPRQYLNGLGVTSALYAVLAAILGGLWAAAFAMGWASAIAVLGIAGAEGAERALDELTRAGQQRLAWILQTRMSRLQRVLLQALREGWDEDRLAAEITLILGSLTSALLVAITETTWASGHAALAVYQAAGVQYVHWKSRRDSLTCKVCLTNDYQGPVPTGTPFKSGLLSPPQHPRCRCALVPAQAPQQQGSGQ